MLKYLYAKEVFQEVPDEVSLGISISNCKIHCDGCHSPELWQNKGKALTWPVLKNMLKEHKGVTCLLLLGGEHEIPALMELFFFARRFVKTAWYCGLDKVPKEYSEIYHYLDYIKLGPYKKELGGLDRPNTNQRFYLIEHYGEEGWYENDLTHLFQKPC